MFDKISIALYPDLAIKHIAVLGVDAPAIKDLEPIELNAEDIFFSEIESTDIKEYEEGNSLLDNLKKISKQFAGKENHIEMPGTCIPGNEIKTIKEEQMEIKTNVQQSGEFSEKLAVAETALSERDNEIHRLKTKLLEMKLRSSANLQKCQAKLLLLFIR